jgi:hypothetical protein
MAKQNNQNSNTSDENVNNTPENNTPVETTKPEVKLVKFRNITTSKVEIRFQKKDYSVLVGGDIEIAESEVPNFLAEHERTNFFRQVI